MKRTICTLKKYLYIFLLVRLIRSETEVVESNIGFVLPSFATPGLGLFTRIFYGLWVSIFIFFLIQRKSVLIGLQKQAVILQGLLFGIDLTLNSIGNDYFVSITGLISLIGAPVCAILSVNDKFMKIFLCMINSFGICYVSTILFRFMSTIKIAVCGAVLYFVLILLISGTEKMQVCFAKIFTVSVACLTLIQLTGFFNIFWGLHGLVESLTRRILHYSIAFVIFALIGIYFVSVTYFSSWVDEKIEQVESMTAAQSEAS